MSKVNGEIALNKGADEDQETFGRRISDAMDAIPAPDQELSDRFYLKDEQEDDGRRRITIVIEVPPSKELDAAE